jgi:TPR repeat protein
MRFLTIIITVCLLTAQTQAQDFETGWEAYKTGDIDKAMSQWRPLAAKNHPEALYWLGVVYDIGYGVHQNTETAAKLFRMAARVGHREAQYEIAMRHYTGVGVLRNRTKAVNWWLKAAEQGHVYAQSWLGFMYFQGNGVTRDLVKSYMWYTIAALPRFEERAAGRDAAIAEMTEAQIAEARRLAQEWREKHNRR